MKLGKSLLFFLTSFPSIVCGDEPSIIGEIFKGESSAFQKSELEELNSNQVSEEVVVNEDGRVVVYQELTIESSLLLSKEAPAQDLASTTLIARVLTEANYTIRARCLPDGRAFVEWGNGPQKYLAWSNICFEDFEGFHSFRQDDVIYSFILFREESSIESLPEQALAVAQETTSNLGSEKPVFSLITELSDQDQAYVFLSALHKIAETNGEELKEATRLRKENAEKARVEAQSQKNSQEETVFRYKVTVDPPQAKE